MSVVSMNQLPNIYTDVLPHLYGHDNDWVASLRQRALKAFEAKGLPKRQDEAWKYARFGFLAKTPYQPLLRDVTSGDQSLPTAEIDGLDCYDLPIVNGRPITGTSDRYNLPDGVQLKLLSELLEEPESWLMDQFEAVLNDPADALDLLNLALANDGWVLMVDEETVLDKPLHIRYLSSPEDQHSMMLRHFVMLGARAKAHVIESYLGNTQHAYWMDSRLHLTLADHATLTHTILQDQAEHAHHSHAMRLKAREHASYRQQLVNLGAQQSRYEIHGDLTSEHIHCKMAGLYLAGGKQVMDHYLPVTHHAPNSYSEQHFKGVLADKAQGVFYGRIDVPKGASGTEAHQQSRVLLLDEGAEADNRPELRILTDDVKCSHGAAIGDLDTHALYYLQARGLSEEQARAMLVEGFLMEVLEDVSLPEALAHYLRERVLIKLQREAL